MAIDKRKRVSILEKLLTIIIIVGVTSGLYLYTSGYRIGKGDNNAVDLSKTGMVSAKSIPDGASVFLDGKLITATNDTLPGIKAGKHQVKIEKKGFVPWTKEIEVYEELVTDITAVLVSQSPRLEPLTNTGAKHPSVSPSLSKLAYFSTASDKPGIWIISLNETAIGLFRNTSTVAIQDTKFVKYSNGKSIQWSPDESELLVKNENGSYYLVSISNNSAQTVANPEKILSDWNNLFLEKRKLAIDKLEMDESMKQLALSSKAVWAPDDKKFLYTNQNGQNLEYKIYNFEKPLPVGEKVDTVVFTTNISDPQPIISWYSDSFHLILTEGNIEKDGRGTISLIRIDGTNKTEVYNNTLFENEAFSAPNGDKIIIVTSFKSGNQTDLYTIGIR